MSKAATKALSFRERRAEFSTRISANGRINVLPKCAIEAEIEKVSLRESLTTLFEQRDRLRRERIKHPQNGEEWNRLNETLNRVQGQLGNCEKMLREAKARCFATVFEFCAEQMLTHEAFLMVRQATWELMGKPYRATNAETPTADKPITFDGIKPK